MELNHSKGQRTLGVVYSLPPNLSPKKFLYGIHREIGGECNRVNTIIMRTLGIDWSNQIGQNFFYTSMLKNARKDYLRSVVWKKKLLIKDPIVKEFLRNNDL